MSSNNMKEINKPKSVNKISLTEKAYLELKRRILDNELPPGTQLMESELAELLEISRTPAREAMTRLEVEGLVEIRSRHGMIVKLISVKDMEEIYAILTGLESTAAWQAAKRDHTPETMDLLRQSVNKMEQALADDNLHLWAESDEEFHRLLVSMSGNQRLVRLVDQFIGQAHRVRMLTLFLRPIPSKSNVEHANVLQAIEMKDAEKARKLHRVHREKAGALLVELLKKNNFTQL